MVEGGKETEQKNIYVRAVLILASPHGRVPVDVLGTAPKIDNFFIARDVYWLSIKHLKMILAGTCVWFHVDQ